MKFSYCFFAAGIIVVSILSGSCKSKYERMVAQELASGERHDSLFFGLSLGMDRKSFYSVCWELNKAGKMSQGSNNLSARYFLFEGLKAPAYLDFYPTFNNDTISEMPCIFVYKDWAPWNTSLSNDSLLVDVLQLTGKWYGNGFFEIKNKDKGDIWVKVDGNRRIKISKQVPNKVQMIITDLKNPPKSVN
jgi:hypothetical protein